MHFVKMDTIKITYGDSSLQLRIYTNRHADKLHVHNTSERHLGRRNWYINTYTKFTYIL